MARVSGDVTHTASLGSLEKTIPQPLRLARAQFRQRRVEDVGLVPGPGAADGLVVRALPVPHQVHHLAPAHEDGEQTLVGSARIHRGGDVLRRRRRRRRAAVAHRALRPLQRARQLVPGGHDVLRPAKLTGGKRHVVVRGGVHGGEPRRRPAHRVRHVRRRAGIDGAILRAAFQTRDVPRSSASSRASLRIRIVFRGSAWWMGTRAKAGSARVRGTARRYPPRRATARSGNIQNGSLKEGAKLRRGVPRFFSDRKRRARTCLARRTRRSARRTTSCAAV